MAGVLMLGAWLAPLPARAAVLAPSPPLRDYAIDLWTSRDGLPHNSIRDIAQTADGYLWFATWEGLVRYNGLDFTTFDRSTRPALADNGIGGLYVDPKGALWLSDSRGNVSRYTPDGKLKIWPRPAAVPEVLIPAMAMDHRGNLWMLFEGRGLAQLTPDGRTLYEAPKDDSPLRTAYTRMVIDARDRIWVGSNEGLVIRDPDGTVHAASKDYGLPAGFAWPYMAPDGTLWVVAQDCLYRLEGEALVMVHQLPDAGRLTALLEDRHGDLWIGTESIGVLRAGKYGIEHLSSGLPLPRGRITSLKEDAEGSVWVGANGGLFRLRETLFTNTTARDGLGSDYVRAVLQDVGGDLWVGNSTGLDRIGPERRISHVDLPTSTGKPPSVLSLAQQRDGTLWIGTANDGLYRRAPDGAVQRYGAEQGLAAGTVRGVSVGLDGVVWLATQRGVARVDGDRVVSPPGVPQTLTTAVYSEAGAVWVGTLEGALVLRGDQVQSLPLEALGGGRTVFGFIRLGDAMWMSTDRGLYRVRGGKLARVGLEQGVPVDAVFQLIPDRDGHLWLTSNRGVLRTDLASLDRVADGLQPRVVMTGYNEMDGMASSQANGSSGPTAVVREDGTLWVATAGGVATVDPRRLQWFRERPSPPVVIDDVEQDGLPLPWRDTPALKLEGGHRLSVSYVGLSYLLPERTEYRTRLEGLDNEWVRRGRQRSVEFIRLPPGDYTLHVSAAHPDGPWSQREAVLHFSIAPFLWQRHSVQAAAGALLLLLLFGLYRYRVHRYQTRTKRLTRLVDERTRDLQVQAQQLRDADRDKTGLLHQLLLQSEAFERQAREDVLTGLPNRRALDERLEQEIARARRGGQPLCMAMLDVDHFKKVNDQYSHGVGDVVLKQVGALLVRHARDADMAARSGGEEFCLVFTDTALEQAAQACARLRELFHGQAGWGGIDGLQITFSAGLVQLEDGDVSPASLYQRADRLLYRAKRNGRDRIEHD
ncbi:ligand-binding sensor domain-containing diguanylate cyclase [Pseudoxanthomonas sp. GM95]|uniref:ligand-binding sensor domain-containing diguanylate cyclase n=1 Tax=Pseudoxanthomonas sp. GM95 TaxID=1881043 RepID=UPI000B817BED|nr:ligand-binding sensor domain-containing diguanylate cyclase [Pseudoxanthomonas sp. GM95]